MEKLRAYIEKWIDGGKVKGIAVSLHDVHECIDIYNAIANGEKPEFINGKAKEILDLCNIKTVACGVGWKVA